MKSGVTSRLFRFLILLSIAGFGTGAAYNFIQSERMSAKSMDVYQKRMGAPYGSLLYESLKDSESSYADESESYRENFEIFLKLTIFTPLALGVTFVGGYGLQLATIHRFGEEKIESVLISREKVH